MTSYATMVALLIALGAAGAPYVIRSFTWNAFIKYTDKEQYEKALALLNTRRFRIFFGSFSVQWNKLRIYLQRQDHEAIERQVNEIFAGHPSRKQSYQVANHVYFYFLDRENQPMSKRILDILQINAKPGEYAYDAMLYRVLLEKKHEDIELAKKWLAHNTENQLQAGILQYVLGLQYGYINDARNQKKYLTRAKKCLSKTPYHKKIKRLLSQSSQ